ncbi:MAG: hypothetical protein WC356_05010 [Candidatus Micrarchaeia archaeon]|jgi:hypothetical protein
METNCVKNAVIRETFLGIEDHGIMVFSLQMDYGGSRQGYGNFGLDTLPCKMIRRVLETIGVDSWEELVGRPCRVKIDDKGWARIVGHFIEDKWFNIQTEAEELTPTGAKGEA